MTASAEFSPCRRYRYVLTRRWATDGRDAMFIGLNPSTADETVDDPTIRRCVQFAKDWGYAGLTMLNLFAWRETDPRAMKRVAEPIGPENDRYLTEYAGRAGVVVAAWGKDGAHLNRSAAVRAAIKSLHYLRLSEKTGQPWHPLYLRASLVPVPWEPRP